jgi:hypothetical protein
MPNSKPKDRTIKLIVQANKLDNSNMTAEEIDKYTSLVEDGGLSSPFGAPNKDFETIVYMSKKVCWSIELSDPNGDDKYYNVALSKVIHKPDAGNPNFFTKDPLTVDPKTGEVWGKIAKNPNLDNKDDSYTIEFTIGFSKTENGGIQTGMVLIELDPKLRISTTKG